MTTAPTVVDLAKRPRPPPRNSGDTIPHSEELSMVSAELGTYVATKGAVEQTSHVLAKELGPRGITVNVVSPGPTDTELFGQVKQVFDSSPAILAVSPFAMERQLYSLATHGATS